VEESVEYFQLAVFKGTYRHRIDPKGRLPVPAAFRRGLGDGTAAVVVTPLDQCLAAYPLGEWSRLEEQLRTLPAFSRPAKALTRLLTSRAIDCVLDVQGRILLPAALRAAAGLEREALVIGVLNRFEVWAPDRWDAFVADSERLLEDATLEVQWPLPPSAPAAPPAGRNPQEKARRV
jgi:transcriptional regulator MraZ